MVGHIIVIRQDNLNVIARFKQMAKPLFLSNGTVSCSFSLLTHRSFLDSTVASKLASVQVVTLSSEVQDKRRKARMKKVH